MTAHRRRSRDGQTGCAATLRIVTLPGQHARGNVRRGLVGPMTSARGLGEAGPPPNRTRGMVRKGMPGDTVACR